MIDTEKKAEYTRFLQTSEGQRILHAAGIGQGETIMKNSIMKNSVSSLMAEVLHPDKQEQFADHPNRKLKPADLTQSTPEAIQGACKEIRILTEEILSIDEFQKLKEIKRRNGKA